jgi:hypothetical protein
LAASFVVGCVTVRKGVFLTPAAQALEPSERAVMEQPVRLWPDYLPFYFPFVPTVKLEDVDCRSGDKWYSPRIEVAPGEHRFFLDAGTNLGRCYFMVTMQPGHVYKVNGFNKLCLDCRKGCCFLEVIDIAPDGKRLTVEVYCGG